MLVAPIPPPIEDPSDEFLPTPENDHPPFTRSTHSRLQPFNVFWANDKWKNLTQGRDLLQCVRIEEARRLGDWISGARSVQGREDESRRNRQTAAVSAKHESLRDYVFDSKPEANPDDVRQSLARTTLSPFSHPDPQFPQAPEGFWEPENPPYEDKPLSDGSTDAGTALTGIEPAGGEHPGPATVVIELNEPGKVKLEMTKTSVPIWQFIRGGGKARLETHTFVIVTTTPRTAFILNAHPTIEKPTPLATATHVPIELDSPNESPLDDNFLGPGSAFPAARPRATVLPGPTSPMRNTNHLPAGATDDHKPGSKDLTPTDEIAALEMPSAAIEPDRPNRPIFFNRDGTVSGKSQSANNVKGEVGLSMDVHELLKTTDWSKTPLGPREQWPQSLKTVGECSDTCTIKPDASLDGHGVPTSMLPLVGQGPHLDLQCAVRRDDT